MTFLIAFALSLVGVLLAQGLVTVLGLPGLLRVAQANGNTVVSVLIFIIMTLVMSAVMMVWRAMVMSTVLKMYS